MDRQKTIIRTSVIGILANFGLAASKAGVGLLANSIAMILDAVNNLTDALSSIVTIIGVKLGSKKPDKEHPLGHGRLEYISALVVSAIIIYAGVTSLIESVKTILEPKSPEHNVLSLIVLGAAIAVKIVLGLYVSHMGKEWNSGALEASGKDALFDALISGSVLVSTILYMTQGFLIEPYVGVFISCIIIKAGVDMIRDTADDIVGRRISPELAKKVKKLITEEPEVLGAYDLFITDYGPNKNMGSVHIELPHHMTVEEVDVLTRRLQEKVAAETGIILTGIGVYSSDRDHTEMEEMHREIAEIVMRHDFALQMHGFHADIDNKEVRFDVVMSFDVDHDEALKLIEKEMKERYPDYEFKIVADNDISD